jgi:hypothetical protein
MSGICVARNEFRTIVVSRFRPDLMSRCREYSHLLGVFSLICRLVPELAAVHTNAAPQN